MPRRERPLELRSFIKRKMREKGLGFPSTKEPYPAVPTEKLARLPWWDDVGRPDILKPLYGVEHLVAEFLTHLQKGNDIFFVIDSPRNVYPYGRGKSTLLLQILAAVAAALEFPFDPRRDLVYQDDEPRFEARMDSKVKGLVWGADELRNFLDRRFSMTSENKTRTRRFAMTRKRQHVAGGCADNMYRLDEGVWAQKATHLVRISEFRQIATVFRKGDYNEAADTWGAEQFALGWADLPAWVKALINMCTEFHDDHYKGKLSALDKVLRESEMGFGSELRPPEADPLFHVESGSIARVIGGS